jgi:osmotically-inducible protein OsmY
MTIKPFARSLVLFVTLLAPAFAAKPVTDDFVNDTIKQHLAADAVVKGGNIVVEVKDGVVTLSGKVQEAKQKDKAEKIAKRVAGVKSVVNKLTIEKP